MPDEHYSGRCFCGDVFFEVTGPALYSCFCHCRSCQRASGGACVPWIVFRRENLALSGSALRLRHSSPGVTRGHCASCGTSLTYEHVDREGQIDIALVAFDDPSRFRPVSHIWVEDKLASLDLGGTLPQFGKTAG